MFPTHQPSYEEHANLMRVEFDPRAPKLRLSVFAYLVENGMGPNDVESTKDFILLLDKIVNYVSADTNEYAEEIAAMEPELTVAGLNETLMEGDNPYGHDGGYR